jgi:uncharacterized RDD family membrane protein YckC
MTEAPPTELATVGQRIGGALIDGLLISMVAVVPILLGLVDESDFDAGLPGPLLTALFLFGAVYTIVPTAVLGQTPGKIAVGTRVVTEADGSVPGWWRSAVRWGLPAGAGRLPYVGLAASLVVIGSLLLDPHRRGLHDRVAGTVVVKVPR